MKISIIKIVFAVIPAVRDAIAEIEKDLADGKIDKSEVEALAVMLASHIVSALLPVVADAVGVKSSS